MSDTTDKLVQTVDMIITKMADQAPAAWEVLIQGAIAQGIADLVSAGVCGVMIALMAATSHYIEKNQEAEGVCYGFAAFFSMFIGIILVKFLRGGIVALAAPGYTAIKLLAGLGG